MNFLETVAMECVYALSAFASDDERTFPFDLNSCRFCACLMSLATVAIKVFNLSLSFTISVSRPNYNASSYATKKDEQFVSTQIKYQILWSKSDLRHIDSHTARQEDAIFWANKLLKISMDSWRI